MLLCQCSSKENEQEIVAQKDRQLRIIGIIVTIWASEILDMTIFNI